MPVLLSALDDDRIWHEQILNALADIGDRRAVAAATAMIGERSDAKVRIVAVRVLGACGGEAEAIALVTHLSSDDSDLRRALSAALVTIGARAVGPILDRFSTLDERGRTAAAQALGSIGGPRAIEALVSAVHDPGDFVRRAAVEALGAISPPVAAEPIIHALGDTDGWVRVAAAHALGQRDDLASLEGLLVALKDENYEVRRAAAGSLGQRADPRAVQGLAAQLRDSDGIVRESAVEALARIGTLDAIAPLVAALEDANRSLRVASGAALKACGWKPGNKMLAALLAVACKRWSEAVRLAEVSVEPLARELLQPDWGYSQVLEAAVRAAAALGEIGLASGATVLLKVIEREAADHDGHPGPRRAIVEAAVRGLEGVFSRNARNVSMEDLQAIGRLSEGAAISLWHSGSVTNFVESWTVDASRLQLLASEELSRRSAERA